MDFADLLKIHGYEPKSVRLARHAGSHGKIYLLWRNKPQDYELYCRIQQPDTFGDQKYVAHFVATPGGETLLTGFFSLDAQQKINPGLIHPLTGQDIYLSESPCPIIYNVSKVPLFDPYAGKLCIDWGKSSRAWNQIAGRTPKHITEIRREFLEPEFPGFSSFSCFSKEVSLLPETWKSVLRASRGIYILVDNEGRQYLGSATGQDGFLGRWLRYEASGHGGNTLLRKLKEPEYRIGVLEICASSDTLDDILKKERDWKIKLGSRAYGLNAN